MKKTQIHHDIEDKTSPVFDFIFSKHCRFPSLGLVSPRNINIHCGLRYLQCVTLPRLVVSNRWWFFYLICFCFIYLHLPLQLDELSRPPYDSVTVTKPQNMADLYRTLTSASSINFRRHCYADWTAGPAPLRRCWTWWTPADTLENLVERLNLHFWNEIQKSQTSGCPHTLGQECIHAGSLFESHFNFHLFVCKIFSKQPRWQIRVPQEIEKAKI